MKGESVPLHTKTSFLESFGISLYSQKYSLFTFSATIIHQIAHQCAYIHNPHTITVPEAKHHPEFGNPILYNLWPINLCKIAVIS